MAKPDFMKKLLELKGAVVERRNIHMNVLETPSPSLNYAFGRGWGLPVGYSMLLMGPPRGGKSVILNSMIGQLHQNDPSAYAIKFDTERREEGQMSALQLKAWGIDPQRYVAYETREPDLIFDRIESEIPPLIEAGMNLKLIGVDSLNNIRGRRSLNAESIMTQNRGDKALTIQEGLDRILDIQRKYQFGIVFTCQIRAQQQDGGYRKSEDSGWDYQEMVRPAISWAPQHFAEYYLYVWPYGSQKGEQDLLEQKFEDAAKVDMAGKAEKTGHKVMVKMLDSSFGPKKRVGMFTFDDNLGIINTHEEVFLLGINHGVIERPNQQTYSFGGETWRGKVGILEAIKENRTLRDEILRQLKARDLDGTLKTVGATSTTLKE